MWKLTEAAVEDAERISALYAESWRTAYRGLIAQHYLDRLPDTYWVQPLRAWLTDGRMNGLMLEDEEGRVMGAIIYGRSRDEGLADWGEIVALYLLPSCARRGGGTRLLRAALDGLRQDGFADIFLWSIEGNRPAEKFYLKHGFRPTEDEIEYQIGGENVRDRRWVMEHNSSAR